jgi:natural product precursor
MFNQNFYLMNNLKLNQLNKQKMTEREMNVIEGGQAPNMCHGPMQNVSAEYRDLDAMTSCTSMCHDLPNQHFLADMHGAVALDSYQ